MKEKFLILVVDDQKDVVKILDDLLDREGYVVDGAGEGEEAIKMARDKFYNVVLLDLKLPDKHGLDVLEEIKRIHPDTMVIIMTAYASVESSIDAMKKGACSYIVKPFNIDEVVISVKNALESQRLHFENVKLIENLKARTKELEKLNRDLTEKQQQLIQSNKMAALGQLSAGLVHELNNPIGGILGYAQYILSKIENKELGKKDLNGCLQGLKFIEKESDRCKTIIDHLLMFSKSEKVGFEPLDLKWIIEMTISMIDYQINTQNITVKKNYEKTDKILGNSNQLQQVFTNIIMNAIHAMPHGGELLVETNGGQGGDTGKIMVVFKDNGCGIKKGDMDKIFDPFFTTKKDSKGLGLGLSVSYRIIQDHNGEIFVDSEMGRGTKFTIKLPKVS